MRSTTPRPCTCMRCAASAPNSSSPANRACCSSSTASSGRFAALTLPYKGTLFGLVGKEQTVLAHGLRGNVVRSTDGGSTWQSVATGVGVGLTASTLDERGRIVIVSQAGHVLVSSDDGASFAALKVERPIPAAAVVSAGAGTLVLAGPRGVSNLPLA